MTLSEKIFGNSIGAFALYGWTAAKAALKPLLVTDNGDGTGTLAVGISSSALPTGASTADLQTAGNASLTSIDAKTRVVTTQINYDYSTASELTLVAAPAAGYRIWIYAIELSALVNIEIAVKDGSTTIRTYRGLSISGPAAPISLTAATALKIQATTADRITGGVSYAVVAV